MTNILHRTHTNATLRKVGKYACDASRVHIDEYGKNRAQGMSNQLCAPSFTPLCMCLFGEKSSSKARSSRSNLKNIEVELIRGSFKNYVDKMRWVVVPEMPFMSTLRVKNVHAEVGMCSKRSEITSTQLLNDP